MSRGLVAKGLRELFGKSRVALYTMDEEASRRGRRGRHDRIALSDITIDDIEALASELKLGEGSAAIITARQAHRKYGQRLDRAPDQYVARGNGRFRKETARTRARSKG